MGTDGGVAGGVASEPAGPGRRMGSEMRLVRKIEISMFLYVSDDCRSILRANETFYFR